MCSQYVGHIHFFLHTRNMTTTPQREKEIYRITIIGSIINLLLLVFKFIAGILGNSAAMVADATHSLTDFVTDIIVIAFVRISSRPEDTDHDYGHGKYETLATAIIGLILMLVGAGLLYNGLTSIISVFRGHHLESPGYIALWAALASILLKELLYQYTTIVGKRLNSQAVIANAWHHRSDAFSSIGTLIGIGGAILLGQTWSILDPMAAVVVSFFIFKVSFQLIKPCVDELVEKSLPKATEDKILSIVESYPQVSSPHHLRTRQIGNIIAIEIHIRMDGDMSLKQAHEITRQIETSLRLEFGENTHIGIHMEPWERETNT